MKKLINIASLLILLISFSDAIAQHDFREGFIITTKNDTIQGLVDYRSSKKNYKSCFFREGVTDTEYLPSQILGYGFINDKYFTSEIIEESFVEVLVQGDLSLYKSNKIFLLQKDANIYELISKKNEVFIDGKKMIQEDKRWRQNILYLISDCIANSNNVVESLSYREKNLTKLIIKYNKCKEVDFLVFKESKPGTKIDWGASIGFSRSTINILSDISYLANSYSSYDPTAGLLISISSPRFAERIAFQPEVYFSQSSYTSIIGLNNRNTEIHESFINLTTISVPLSIKYSFPGKKFMFYSQIGLSYEYHLDAEAKVYSESISNNIVNTFPPTTFFEINTSQIGYWGGIGILKSYSRFKASVSLRYFQMTNLNSLNDIFANNNRISLNLIIFNK